LPAAVETAPTDTFEYEGDLFELSIPKEAKVVEAKAMVVDRYHAIAGYVSLLLVEGI
jgi:hypothetical protein